MLDIGWSELVLIGIVALIVVGPKDLPGMFHTLGRFTAKARGMAKEFSRAMEDAAKEAGVDDVAKDLKSATSKKALGLDALERAADRFEKWDPKLPAQQAKAAKAATGAAAAVSGTEATAAAADAGAAEGGLVPDPDAPSPSEAPAASTPAPTHPDLSLPETLPDDLPEADEPSASRDAAEDAAEAETRDKTQTAGRTAE